jgi:3-oxoacyl-[acyl-carrier protein] reductase
MNGHFQLNGKVALVTGAARGIGAAIARTFAAAGADICLNHLDDAEDAERLRSEIEAQGRRAIAIAADIADPAAVEAMFVSLIQRLGRLDILVNNAGITRAEDIFDTSLESWEAVLRTNLNGAFLCSKHAMQLMREQARGGRIIQLGSVTGHQGALYGHLHYATSKAGLHGFTKTLARTGAPFGITVNALAPGLVATELLYETHGQAGVAELAKLAPLGLSSPADVAAAALYLASDEARTVTGAILDINGGMYMR